MITNSSNQMITNHSMITNRTSNLKSVIVGASFTISSHDLYKIKNNEHYNDIHKIIYDQYFKDYNQHQHHHHHHHHQHHKHKSHHYDQDHDRDHQDHDQQDHDQNYKDTNDKTISSSWIYNQLKQYLTCIYHKQINCEDQFVTKLQLELLKIQKKKEKYENIKIQQQQQQQKQQTPILTVKLDTKKQPYTKRIHEKEQKETRHDSSIIYQLNNRKEIEKSEEFTTHEFYQSLNKDKHLNYYYHEHHRHRDHRDHHPYPILDHHRHKDHHRSSSHYEYGWFDKMDNMMKKLEDDKHDDDDDDDDNDDDGRKGKDKHSHHPPTYRKHLHKY
ncbi:unnamed protein product [Schistosoma rodhaini]|uniref:Uncharacterized protein n=1 Tax=Schistosoma rodhaini TaxID=6188 RepID=A0AA85FLF6_9TREM|nr:unnamed protein product [Schistosoma rodhaini]